MLNRAERRMLKKKKVVAAGYLKIDLINKVINTLKKEGIEIEMTKDMERKINKKIEELITKGVKKAPGIKKLVAEFGITNSIANEQWTKVKSKSTKLQDKAVENGLRDKDIKEEKLFDDFSKEGVVCVDNNSNASRIVKEEPKHFIEGLTIKKLEGTYKGIDFIKDDTGVTVGEMHFNNMNELIAYSNEEVRKFKERTMNIAEIFSIGE